MQVLYVNNNTLQSLGTDTNYNVELGKTYKALKIRLQSFQCPNYFSNFGLLQGEQDFSYQTGAGTFSLTISQINLNINNFITYFNSVQSNLVLTQTNNYGILTLTGNVAWLPVGLGWSQKMGYSTLTGRTLNTIQVANTYFNLEQSQNIYVRLGNLQQAYVAGDGSASFKIPLAGLSTFGGALSYDLGFQEIYQEVKFGQEVSFSNLQVQLLDSNYNIIQTQNNNNTGMSIEITFSLWEATD